MPYTPNLRLPLLAASLLLLAGCATQSGLITQATNSSAAPVVEIAPQQAAVVPPATPAATPSVTPPVTPPAKPAQSAPLIPVPAAPAPTSLPLPKPAEHDSRALLQRLLPEKISERNAWANDIQTAFIALRVAPTAQNFCAAIAIIEQESSFQADPVVPGLPRMVWKEIEKRRSKYAIPRVMLDLALRKSSPDGRSYKARIDALKTEREMNALFEEMIAELPEGKRLLSGYNPIRTGGPMQVSVAFAQEHVRVRPYPYTRTHSLRDEVFTRRGGVYFGIANLLDYPASYSQHLYRFADFNAGHYSSRNAAFQQAVAQLTRRKLALDGDLLRYADGIQSSAVSGTEQALRTLGQRLRLNAAEIRRDLKQEKYSAFAQTPLYQRVYALAEQQAGHALPREMLPRIRLSGPKIQRKLTTAWFAKRVDWRYHNCLARDAATDAPASLSAFKP